MARGLPIAALRMLHVDGASKKTFSGFPVVKEPLQFAWDIAC